MQTEFDFLLPRGYIDRDGTVHRNGRMRLALAIDEVDVANDPRVETNPAYVPILLLSRVITQLGSVTAVTPQIIEHMFASDLVYLQELYLRLNSGEKLTVGAVCPTCQAAFTLQVSPLG